MNIKDIMQRMNKVKNGDYDEWFNAQFPQHPIIADIYRSEQRFVMASHKALSNGLPKWFRMKHQSKKMLLFITQKEIR